MTDISIDIVALTITVDNLIKYLSWPPDHMIQEDRNPVLFNLASQPLAQCWTHSSITVCQLNRRSETAMVTVLI